MTKSREDKDKEILRIVKESVKGNGIYCSEVCLHEDAHHCNLFDKHLYPGQGRGVCFFKRYQKCVELFD